MIKVFRIVCSIFLVASMCTALTGCISEPPSLESVEEHFQKNREDIQIVVDFLVGRECPHIYIDEADGTMREDLETVEIEDEGVNKAIKRLLGRSILGEQQYKNISRERNTILLDQWHGSMDIGAGIGLSVNGEDLPYPYYCTEIVSMSEPGWYYYVEDYNAWRVGKRPQTEGLISPPSSSIE